MSRSSTLSSRFAGRVLIAGLALAAGGLCAALQPGAAYAQALEVPTRQLRIVVPFTAAGPNDFITRLIAQKLGERWG